MKGFLIIMYAIAGGLTLSGIVANVYRLLAKEPKNTTQNIIYYVVMVFGGPSVLFDNATRSFRKKECSGLGLTVALGLASWWAMILGAILLDIIVSV